MNGKQSAAAAEALQRAVSSDSVSNYPAIYSGFLEKGIPESEILPRENVFTYHAWRAKGRQVKRGEHGVRVVTYIETAEKRDLETGEITRKASKFPKGTTVFHVSQTKEIEGK